MTATPPAATGGRTTLWPSVFSGLTGLVFGLVLVKLGNPVIFDTQVPPPTNPAELFFQSWPVKWGFWLLGGVTVLGLTVRQRRKVSWFVLLPLVWLGWQCLSSTQTIDYQLTAITLKHFSACVACFFFGFFFLGQPNLRAPFWFALLAAFLFILWVGWDQKFGGLEKTRQWYQEIKWEHYPPQFKARFDTPEFRAKIASNRVFSTFVYPNALAGAILLFLPALLAAVWQLSADRFTTAARGLLVALLGGGGLACLYWSGSKAGWLIALLLALVGLSRLSWSRRTRMVVVGILLVVGLAGFSLKFKNYFAGGARSFGARLDYWRVAIQILQEHPLLGTGPGTFALPYKRLKAPEAEIARLAHNDYLEQASDSGMVGFLAYTSLVLASLVWNFAKARAGLVSFSLWLGLLGWAMQGLVEFGLYIPALAWPAFLFLGWLWAVEGPSAVE